uniref:Related to shuttle craft protein n=1 Tax=Melanopsichium pennsylvanicum 4 TaxID=1398559 RepID=A0A077R614_9BASI|nr:related to shuttle craft protein [Melanopsichium pennsylvanicum 4]
MSDAFAAASAAHTSLSAIQNLHLESQPSSSVPSSSQSSRSRNRAQSRGRGGGRGKKSEGGKSDRPVKASDNVPSTAMASSSSHQPPHTTQSASNSQHKRNRRRGGGDKSGQANRATSYTHSHEDDTQEASAPPRVAVRRQQFGGKLTGGANSADEPASNSSRPSQNGKTKKPAVKLPPVAEPVEYADLRSRLLAELSSGEYDCVICYSTVTTRQATWSCSQCYSVLHLPCVRKWAESSVKKAEEHNAMQEDPEIRNRREKMFLRYIGAGVGEAKTLQEAEVPIPTAVASAVAVANALTDVPTPATPVLAPHAPSPYRSSASAEPRPSLRAAHRLRAKRHVYLHSTAVHPAATLATRCSIVAFTRVKKLVTQAIVSLAPSKWKRAVIVASTPRLCAVETASLATALTTRPGPRSKAVSTARTGVDASLTAVCTRAPSPATLAMPIALRAPFHLNRLRRAHAVLSPSQIVLRAKI